MTSINAELDTRFGRREQVAEVGVFLFLIVPSMALRRRSDSLVNR